MSTVEYRQLDKDLLAEFSDQAHNPPGKDSVLGAFYQTLAELKNHPIIDALAYTKEKRPITDKHLANLVYRVFQAFKFEEETSGGNISHAHNLTQSDWIRDFDELVTNPQGWSNFQERLERYSTTTTIYQRYAGPRAVTSYMFNGYSVDMIDLGCGGNHGLRGIDINAPFKPIEDHTPVNIVQQYLSNRINLRTGLAVDQQNPDDPEIQRWRLACSFYPQELGQVEAMKKFEEEIKKSQKVRFLQANLLDPNALNHLPQGAIDVAILSTILYQLDESNQNTLINLACRTLKPDGVLVVQDFAAKNPQNPASLDFGESWFATPFGYRTFVVGERTNWEFLEALQWNNGRCTSVKPGADFDKIFI